MFSRVQKRFFVILEGGYERLLRACFARPWITIGAGALSVTVAVLIFFNLPLQLMPKAERDSFAVEIHLPEGSSLKRTAKVCEDMEQMLRSNDSIESVTTFVGSSSPRFMATYSPQMPGKNYAQMIVKTRGSRHTEGLMKHYKDACVDTFAEASIRFKQLDYQAVNNPIEIRLRGDNLSDLRTAASKLMEHLRADNDLVWVHSDFGGTMPAIKLELKPEEASRLGITKAMLSANLAALYSGVPVATIWEDDYKMQVKLYTDDNATADEVSRLSDLLIPTAMPGLWVPLRQVATIEPDWQQSCIAHRNGTPCLTVGADLSYGCSQPVAMKHLRPWLEQEFAPALPDGVSMSYGGLNAVNNDTLGDIIVGLIASVAIVFFFLLFNFKKIRLTLLSLCGTLLCLLGAFVGLWIFGCDVSMTAIIGIVSLIGINVRNTIVMFDYAEELKADGMRDPQHPDAPPRKLTVKEVAFEAGIRRMRPIFLTSATTAVGVIPMIIHRSTLWMPMGVVICFGTICAIGFIVTVLPVAYWKLFDRTPKPQPAS